MILDYFSGALGALSSVVSAIYGTIDSIHAFLFFVPSWFYVGFVSLISLVLAFRIASFF